MGSPGQANYAAANAFLDALADHRRAHGLAEPQPGVGPVDAAGTGHDGASGCSRVEPAAAPGGRCARGGGWSWRCSIRRLFTTCATVVPMRLDLGRMQREATQASEVPPLLRALLRPGLRRVGAAAVEALALRQRLIALPREERLDAVLTLVREQVAASLGAPITSVPADRPLLELGLDSLMAVELRNQLSAQAQTPLPATLVFDYPTPKAIAELLYRRAFAELDVARAATVLRATASDEPIAIVAMACRAPGGVVDPEGYWALLDEGRDAIGPFPAALERGGAVRPRPRGAGQDLRARRRVPRGGRSVRRVVLRHLAARGGGDGPAAAAAARGRRGRRWSARACARARSASRHRGVRRLDRHGLRRLRGVAGRPGRLPPARATASSVLSGGWPTCWVSRARR